VYDLDDVMFVFVLFACYEQLPTAVFFFDEVVNMMTVKPHKHSLL
jgi:hypothetical protein